MLVVKDFEKLKAFGFENVWGEKNIWRKELRPRDINIDKGVVVEMVVNPLSDHRGENEVMLYVYADTSDFHGRTEVDMLLDFDIVFEMLMLGIVKYVPKGVLMHGENKRMH